MKKNFKRLGCRIAGLCQFNSQLFVVILMTALCAAVFTSCEKDDVPTYTVSFDSKGGAPTPQQQTVKEDGKVTKPADPTRDNFTFDGWAKADNETSALWNFETETVTENMTLFARWAIISYPVTFDSDGGSEVAAQNVAHGSSASKPADPTRNGYAFDGWFSGETEWNFSTAITAPVSLKAKWTVVHAVTFDSDGGSEVAAQTIRNGSTATRPADPTKSIASGLYLGTLTNNYNYTFVGWYNGETLWNFDTSVVTAPITLKARWSIDGKITRIESVLSNDIAASFTYVNANSNGGEEYTLLLGTNVTTTAQTLNSANAKLTIAGIGVERIITTGNMSSLPTSLFTINGNNVTNLTLEQNITINGGSQFLYPSHIVHIQRGSMTMRDGSKITGYSGYAGNSYNASTVFVEGLNASFKMEGGEISENLPRDGNISLTAGVSVRSGGTFEMSGGSITGNNNGYSTDLNIGHDCLFRLFGNARIGVLMLYADNATVRASITVAGNYNGTVTTLHLLSNTWWSESDVVAFWTNVPVIVNGTANVISMFNNGLGDFRNSFGSSVAPISATHILNASGILVLREN